jgi:hypothetical protein
MIFTLGLPVVVDVNEYHMSEVSADKLVSIFWLLMSIYYKCSNI